MLAVMLAVHRASIESTSSIDEGGERLLRELAGALEQPAAGLWILRGNQLVLHELWCEPAIDREAFARSVLARAIPKRSGFAGVAWERCAPTDQRIADRLNGGPARAHSALGLRETIAFPCSYGQNVLGVVQLCGAVPVELSDHLIEVLTYAGRGLGAFLSRRRGELGLSSLTRRELQVLTVAGEGLSVPEIARRLAISPYTAKTHLTNVYRKLDVHDRTAAVAAGLRSGYIE
jgi:DNA-binding CsgD family transcriptional regulator